MRHSSTSIATHWRRRFITGATAVIVAGTGTHAKADFRYRLGLSQPLDSPNYLRLQEMAEKVRLETNDRMLIEVHGAGKLGSDSAMLALLQKNELEMYLGGNVFGPLVPITEMSGLPFIFKNSADVFAALDGEFGDYVRAEMLAKGMYAFRRGLDNGFHQLTTRTKPIRTVDDLVGTTIRTPVQTMTVEFFEALGAKPMKFTLNQLYEVLKNHTVDGQTDPLGLVVLMKLYEVQTYISLTKRGTACGRPCNSENSKANRIETMKGPAESGQICSGGRRKIAKKVAKNKRCYANTLRPRSRMLLKVMKGG